MAPAKYDLAVYRGDDFSTQITFKDSTGATIVLPTTGWAAQIRASRDANAVAATITVDSTQAALGIIRLSLPASATAALHGGEWDLQQTGGGVRTWLRGSVLVTGDVTRV